MMFDFKNNHKTEIEILKGESRKNAVDYAKELDRALEVLKHIDNLLNGSKVTVHEGDSHTVYRTAPYRGKQFVLTFTADSKEPISAEVEEVK